MITDKEKREYFQRECRSIDYFEKKIIECNDRLAEISLQLNGVSSPSMKEVVYENARNPYQERKNILLTEEAKVIAERDEWQRRISYVKTKLESITNKRDLAIIKDLYINKMNHETVAHKYHYASRMSLYKYVNKVLDKLLKEDTM